jgi:predicted S18 family serine protease
MRQGQTAEIRAAEQRLSKLREGLIAAYETVEIGREKVADQERLLSSVKALRKSDAG